MLRREGFVRHQYSDYRRPNSQSALVWILMVQLPLLVQPPGKLESTVLGLKMHHIISLDEMDVGDKVRLGGQYSPSLRGPTPAGLVPAGGLATAPVIPGPHFVRPAGTRSSAAANNPINYRV